MNKRKKILVVLLLIFIAPVIVLANNGGNSSGGSGSVSGGVSCNGCSWAYLTNKSVGVRLSLYRYDGNNLRYYGSRDYCATGDSYCFKNPNAVELDEDIFTNGVQDEHYQTVNKAGKVAYQNLSSYSATNWSSEKGKITISKTLTFPALITNNGSMNSNWDNIEQTVKNAFMNSTYSLSDILQKVKDELGASANDLTINDLPYLYLTIEPTFSIARIDSWTKNSAGQEVPASGDQYYGTIYELASWSQDQGYLDVGALNNKLYYQMPSTFLAQKLIGVDNNNFVGTSGKYITLLGVGKNDLVSDGVQSNIEKIVSKEGYAINVFFFGSDSRIEQTPQPSCTISASNNIYTLSVNNLNSGYTYYYDINSNVNELRHNVKNTSYSVDLNDTTVIGQIYDYAGNEIAACSLTRTPQSCEQFCDVSWNSKGYSDKDACVSVLCDNGDESGDDPTDEPIVETCAQTCSGKSGDSLLACAESYCQTMSDDASEKKTCITTCGPGDVGYQDPGFSSCGARNTIVGGRSECEGSAVGSVTTCTKANQKSYFKTTCIETSTISYGNSLPVTVSPGFGFSYTPVLSGNKTCNMTFEVDKWKFDYAAAYTSDKRNKLISILNEYNVNSFWNKEVYSYSSDDAEIKITINNDDVENGGETTHELIVNSTTNLLSDNVVVTYGGSTVIPLYANGSKTTKTIYNSVRTGSSNRTYYKLPAVCLDASSGEIYEVDGDGNCNSVNDGPYNDYYTGMRIAYGSYDTETTVSKSSSALNASSTVNTCNYNVARTPVSCSIRVVDCTNDTPTSASLFVETNYSTSLEYGLASDDYRLNGQENMTITSSVKRLYGAVGLDGEIIATCSLDITNATCPEAEGGTVGSTCTALYEVYEIENITSYCTANWDKDTAGYTSRDDCISSCSAPRPGSGASTTCTSLFASYETENITSYCTTNWDKDTAGYTSRNDCISSCSAPRPGSGTNATCTSLFVPSQVDKIVNYCAVNWNADTAGYTSKNDCISSCSSSVTGGGTSSTTCTTMFKATEYDEIDGYCSYFWMNDTANYASQKDCFNSCSSGANTCKSSDDVDTSNFDSVKSFCSDINNLRYNGYNNPLFDNEYNIAMCVNDCYTPSNSGGGSIIDPPDGECLGVICDYLYRPISLIDPFPNNRTPGYNWIGKEIFVTDDLLNPVLNPEGAEAEYVIELTPSIMDLINKDTDQYNSFEGNNAYIDYVYNNDADRDGKYLSKFIHSYDNNAGGFGSYFTKIIE